MSLCGFWYTIGQNGLHFPRSLEIFVVDFLSLLGFHLAFLGGRIPITFPCWNNPPKFSQNSYFSAFFWELSGPWEGPPGRWGEPLTPISHSPCFHLDRLGEGNRKHSEDTISGASWKRNLVRCPESSMGGCRPKALSTFRWSKGLAGLCGGCLHILSPQRSQVSDEFVILYWKENMEEQTLWKQF